jgi:tripartite-type tricarboxylate transporter receptor subunit TctC
MTHLHRFALTLLSVAFAFTTGLGAICVNAAEKFPTRPVRLIVPYAPGGATDITARQLAAKLSDVWGQQVIVDNRAGASGNIALELTAKATPDGYTLMVGNVSTNAINETTFAKTLPIKPSRDLTGVTNLIELPHLWVINPGVPVASLKELIQYAKRPDVRLNYASAGVGSYPHLDAARLLKFAGVTMTHVPYKGGAGQMIPAVIGNEAQFMFVNMASSLPNIRAGRLKALATTWPTRRPELPDVPTVTEAGYPGFGTNAWNGLFAPAPIAKSMLQHIFADVVKIMADPQMKELLAKQFMSVVTNNSPAEFQSFVQDEVRKWGKVAVENNITVE